MLNKNGLVDIMHEAVLFLQEVSINKINPIFQAYILLDYVDYLRI